MILSMGAHEFGDSAAQTFSVLPVHLIDISISYTLKNMISWSSRVCYFC